MVPAHTADLISVHAAMPRGLNPFAQPFVPAHSTQQLVPPLDSLPDSAPALAANVPTVGVSHCFGNFFAHWVCVADRQLSCLLSWDMLRRA